MILVGRYLSPFTRRCAASMKALGIRYEHKPLSTITQGDEIRKINPVGRVPALVLDDGEVIVDSTAILDYVDEKAGPKKALTPTKGKARRDVLRLCHIATGAMDKTVQAAYERNRKAKDKVDENWARQMETQADSALRALEAFAKARWFVGTRMTQADVTVKCLLDFIRAINPKLMPKGKYPKLEAFSARLDKNKAFAETKPEV